MIRFLVILTESAIFLSFLSPQQESQHTQTQMEYTQLTQPGGLTPDESSNLMFTSSCNLTPLSPPPVEPFGRLIPCVPSANLTAADFLPTQDCYWLGRSHKCDVTAQYSSSTENKKEQSALEWGKSMISNRHCRIFQQVKGNQIFIEDNSGNGTFINQGIHLQKGETRILHSGDEICLINSETLRKKISSHRIVQMVLQQFSFVFVVSKPRKSCVNPRAMNYNFGAGIGRNNRNNINNNEYKNKNPAASPTATTRRIETFYDMREVLGDGTSGQVRRAIHRQSGKERAVKVINLRRHVDTSMMEMMEREVSILQSIDHPYIVKLVEVFVEHGVAMYLVMELVKGGDLFDSIVEKQRYTEVEARRAMRRLLSAIHYLHEDSNIVHRDLKPENILCSSPTHVKLADFGLAKIVKSDGLKTFCGTPAYFAPEVLQRRGTVAGQGRYGKPADMWSLGVILYILLTGKPPFDTNMDEFQGFEVDFESDLDIWSTMSAAKELVAQMLRKDPKRRLTVRQACDHSWINVDDGDTHCHPLDDPAVTTNKRLFKQELEVKNLDGVDDSAPYNNDEIASQCSKDDSVLSKEESDAAISSHSRTDSVFHLDITDLPETNMCNVNASNPSSMSKIQISKPPSPSGCIKQMPLESDNNNNNISAGGENVDDDDDDDDEIKTSSPDGIPNTNTECLDNVSFSDDVCQPPRSPLTKLNLNKRGNQFRDQILIKQTDLGSPSLDASELFESSDGNRQSQTAVTPTSSNIKRQREQPDSDVEEPGENMDDPILSQFSSEPSSVESFSDSSISSSSPHETIEMNETSIVDQVCLEPSQNKRCAEEGNTNNSSKRPKINNSKQTTLNAWLVKK